MSLQTETDDNNPLDDKQKDHLHKLVKSIKGLHLAAL
jgi:hypothetical protein